MMAGYPPALFALHQDHYKPGVIGIRESLYEHAVHDAPHPHWKYFWFD